MPNLGFLPVRSLLPTQENLTKWSVIACDQYTSDPTYWERVDQFVGEDPSTLRMIYPEVWLDQPDRKQRIEKIHQTMEAYLANQKFSIQPEGYLYLERTLRSGKVRRGLIGCIDLEKYQYGIGTKSPVRPTEWTVEERLPPRVQIRRGAPMELPHVMVLTNDPGMTILEPLSDRKPWMKPLYDFSLMEGGGHLKGWALDVKSRERVETAMKSLSVQLYAHSDAPLCLAIGDGNHSLAAAKAYFDELKERLPKSQWEIHPARYAMVELCNLYDEGLDFEPIHRIVYTSDVQKLLADLNIQFSSEKEKRIAFLALDAQDTRIFGWRGSVVKLIEALQGFLDSWVERYGGRIDYIHGEKALRELCKFPNRLGLLLPSIKKQELFVHVQKNGPLSRKSFSLGEAWDKRYYLEARTL